MRTPRLFPLLLLLLFLCFATTARAARHDTAFTFSTIETAHFSVHFHQGLEPLAQKAARMAEEIHPRLTAAFQWEPTQKTQMVLIDDTDFANGYATPLPYNTIYLQTVPPALTSTLGEYDDWLRTLITHEYTHIVTSDPARGYAQTTRSIFGKTIPGNDPFSLLLFLITAPPNVFMPHWWHEGMATWSETEFSGAGRGRASMYDTIFRMAVAEGNLPTIDRINGELPYWPDGHLPYLYGYRLVSYLADSYGTESPGTLSRAQSSRFPYFINRPAKELSGGKDFTWLFNDMIAQMKREQEERIDLLSRVPFTPLESVSRDGENLTHPRFSPDGSRIAFNRNDPHEHTTTVIADRDGRRVLARFRRLPSDGSLCWSPDGDTVYFTQAEINRGFDVYQDLYAFDLKRDRVTRLTRGQRLRDVDLAPDGQAFVGVVSDRGSQHLAVLPTRELDGEAGAKPRLLTRFSQQRVSSPRWAPDSRNVVYALTDNTGQTGFHLLDIVTGRDRLLFATRYSAAYPVWSRDGSALIYVSNETGVFNLFAYGLKEGKSYQVSHLLGGALMPDLSPDGKQIAIASYTSRGFEIATLEYRPEARSERRGPTLPPIRPVKEPAAPAATTPDTAQAAPYSVWRTLYPHFWLPRITGDGGGSGVYGFYTAGQDVLGYNTYLLNLDYSPGRSRPYFNLHYLNDRFYPTLSLQAYATPFLYGDLLQRGDYYELDQSLTLEVSVPVNRLESRLRVRGGYQILDQRALSGLDSNREFRGIDVFQGRRDNLFAGIDFTDRLKYPYSISAEEGQLASLLFRRFDRAIGSDLDSSELSASYSRYLRPAPATLRHHVLYLNAAGALAEGDRTPQQAFQLGGIPSDLNPYYLRGYKARSATGRYLVRGTVEYRLPIGYPLSGSGTFPLFEEKLHAALFLDAGKIWSDRKFAGSDEVRVGAGGELRLDVTLGYWLKVTPAVGFAHGFQGGGTNQIYLNLYAEL